MCPARWFRRRLSWRGNIPFIRWRAMALSQGEDDMAATVLVVEDEPAIQELIAYNLKQAGHQPLRADSAEQALRLVQDALPDLVLLDWMLPGLSGIELARRL